MVVVDSSAVLVALAASDGGKLADRLAPMRELHAPELIDVELLLSLRRLIAIGALSAERAQHVRDDLVALRLRRHTHAPLVDRVWQLRDQMSPSEGMFLALAELLELPLITCDPALADASADIVDVELLV